MSAKGSNSIMPPVYEYSVVVKLGDGKTKKEKKVQV